MPARTSSAVWTGDLKSGKGSMKLGSGAWEGQFSFQSRFEEGTGTNPEELAAAAHAGCFSMAFSNELAKAGFAITRIDLVTEGQVPGIDNAKFQEIAQAAKKGCPISKLFTGAQINLDAKLV